MKRCVYANKCAFLIILTAFLLCLCSCGTGSNEAAEAGQSANSAVVMESVKPTGNGVNYMKYNFKVFNNVKITGVDLSSLSEEQLSVLYTQARYCQAMTDADIDVMREIVSEDMTFTHMSGMKQSREEYFADIAKGRLNYHTIGIENPEITVNDGKAAVTFTSVLNANAYGARGTYRMKDTHHYENRGGVWIAVNG